MKRYAHHVDTGGYLSMLERDYGDWVKHADHAAFVERVREIAENMQHWETCDVLWREIPAMHNAEAYCTCPRGQLLEVLNG